jgi:hypothetical protein
MLFRGQDTSLVSVSEGSSLCQTRRTPEGKGWGLRLPLRSSVLLDFQEKSGNALASRRKITKTKSMLRLLWLLSALLMSYVPSLVACEGCKEPANVIGASGVAGIGASFSWSVLFMIGMLAFLMSGMVFMMIRSCRQLAAQHQRIAMESH